jgi:polysaccharide biosynthesis protein PslH
MARIIVVKAFFPYPPSQGTRRVSLSLLKDLATAHDVRYLCQLDNRGEAALIPEVEKLGVRVVAPLMPNHISFPHKVLYKLKNIALGKLNNIPPICYFSANHVLRANLRRLCDEFKPDLTILESWETFRLRDSITHGASVLLAHDVAWQIAHRSIAAADDEQTRRKRTAIADRHRELETAAWKRFDGILTLTEADRDFITAEVSRHESPSPVVTHLPVPVAEEFFTYHRPQKSGQRIGFLGTFKADFNRDALSYLLKDLWPEIESRIPEARLHVAGNGYTGSLKSAVESIGGSWHGFVDDLSDFFAEIDVLLVPLRFGAGVRIRILEALAAGVPVVATSIAVASLALTENSHYRLGDNPRDIADQLAWTIQNPSEAAAMGAAGRDWCARHHGPDILQMPRLAAVSKYLPETD